MSDNEMSAQMYIRRIREPPSEPWMIEGLKLMRRERKISRINKVNLEKEQLLIQKQARREARSRAASHDASSEAAAAADRPPSPDGSDDLFDLDYPASQYRYMENQQRKKDQAIASKAAARVEKRIASVAKDRIRVQATQASKAELRAVFFGSFPRKTSTIVKPDQQAASSESSALAIPEVTSSTDVVVSFENSAKDKQAETIYVYPDRPSKRSSEYQTDMDSSNYFDSTSESDVSGSYDDDLQKY